MCSLCGASRLNSVLSHSSLWQEYHVRCQIPDVRAEGKRCFLSPYTIIAGPFTMWLRRDTEQSWPAVWGPESPTWDWDQPWRYTDQPRWPPPAIDTFLPCVTTWNPAYHTCSWPFAALDDITHFGLLTADGAPTQRFIYLPNPSGVWREQGEKCKVRLQWRCSKQSTKYTRKLHLHTLTVHSVSVRVFSLYSWQI